MMNTGRLALFLSMLSGLLHRISDTKYAGLPSLASYAASSRRVFVAARESRFRCMGRLSTLFIQSRKLQSAFLLPLAYSLDTCPVRHPQRRHSAGVRRLVESARTPPSMAILWLVHASLSVRYVHWTGTEGSARCPVPLTQPVPHPLITRSFHAISTVSTLPAA